MRLLLVRVGAHKQAMPTTTGHRCMHKDLHSHIREQGSSVTD